MKEKQTRTHLKTIRMTPNENEILTEILALNDMNFSTFVRSSMLIALGLPTHLERDRLAFDDSRAQLRGCATNLNQLARSANTGKLKWSDKDRATVKKLHEYVAAHHQVFVDYIKAAHRREIIHPDDYAADFDVMLDAIKCVYSANR